MDLFTGEIIGNIGSDAVIKESKEGKYTMFSVAVTSKQGGTEKTLWVRCFKSGEELASILKKGGKVFVQGKIDIDSYEGKPSVSMWARNVISLSKKDENGGGQ